MKTLKREGIYANDYLDLEHLRDNIEIFIVRLGTYDANLNRIGP